MTPDIYFGNTKARALRSRPRNYLSIATWISVNMACVEFEMH